MSIITDKECLQNAAMHIAELMVAAAKTAPKGRGLDPLEYLIISDKDIEILACKMSEMSERDHISFLHRDAGNIRQSNIVILIGSNTNPKNVPNCRFCGFGCDKKPETTPCAIGAVDLGIAISSAANTAMLHKADNRILYSAGVAALELDWFKKQIKHAYGIPISLTAKSPFFDRK